MRTYQELNNSEKEHAKEHALDILLGDILGGGVRFNDKANGDDLQARIDAACAKAEEMHTPWFADEYILDTCREELEGMAIVDAEDALYPDPEERIIRLRKE